MNGLSGALLRLLLGRRYIVFCHGNDILRPQKTTFYRRLLILILKHAEGIIANSDFTKGKIIQLIGTMEKVYVLNPGVDYKHFNPSVSPHEVIVRHSLQNKKVILTVSRLVPRKGHDLVIRSMTRVLKVIPNTVYLIAGSGPEEHSLRKLVSELDLHNRVIFAGRVSVDDLPKYYNACDALIMVSEEIKEEGDVEGFGIVYLEANACGKPVICGKTGGTEDSVIDGVTGLKVDTNENEVSKALIKLLTKKKLAENLGKNGRIRAIKQFNWKIVATRLEEILLKTACTYRI